MRIPRLVVVGGACVALSIASQAAQTAVKRIQVAPDGVDPNNGVVHMTSAPLGRPLSADGRYFAFASAATNLVAGDSNWQTDVFVHDRLLHITRLASVSSSGVQGNQASTHPSVSNDGNLVAFSSAATNLVPGTPAQFGGIYVRDFAAGTTTRESLGAGGVDPNAPCLLPSLSGDGRVLVFASKASNLVPNDAPGTSDIFARDRVSGAVSCVSVNLSGQPGGGNCDNPTISNNGRFVVFLSFANDLVPGDTNNRDDLFVRDLATGVTELITPDVIGFSRWSFGVGSASDDGRYIAFSSAASSLVLNDWNGLPDVFLRDRLLGTTTLLTVTPTGAPVYEASTFPIISADGSVVVYASSSDELTSNDQNGVPDIFKFDRVNGVTSLVSVNPDGTSGDGASTYAAMSANGRTIAFRSVASDLDSVPAGIHEKEFVSEAGALSLVYCTAGTSGNGCVPSIQPIGAPSASAASQFLIRVSGVDSLRTGMIFYGIDNPDLDALPWGATSSSLCVKSPVQRTPTQSTGGATGPCDGQLQLNWNSFVSANSGALGAPFAAGTTIHAQGWYRDPANTKSSSLSNALAIEMNP